MLVQKRDGKTQEFDNKKIYCAIESAALDVMPFIDTKTEGIIKRIVKEIKSEFKKDPDNTPTVEEIQDKVEEKLMGSHLKDVARAYIRYRYKKEVLRKSNTTDQSIFELLSGTSDYWNNENANKNPKTVTTQRDYIAGITSTDITKRFLLDKDIVKAHEEGIIHFHDADYFAQAALHNCFSIDTKFITSMGVKSFRDFKEGEEVLVPTHTGEWKRGIVKKYGKQELYKYTFKRGNSKEKVIYATENHRWILKDGSITTDLKIGDWLIKTPIIADIDFDTATLGEKQLWCKGFAYGDGQYCKGWGGTKIRLCGYKNKYRANFISAGYSYTVPPNFKNGDAEAHIPHYNKNEIPDMNYKDVKYFVHGLLSADGDRPTNVGSTTSNEFKGIQVTGEEKNKIVYNLLNIAGYYVSSFIELTGTETNYNKRNGQTRRYQIQANQSYHNWKVINKEYYNTEEVWCLEVEDNHSFILEGGITTGNCELLNLEDILQNGTVINGVMIEKPHRLLTAATIATQVILAVTSSSYGGCTVSLTHLAPFVRSSYEYYVNKYKEAGLKEEDALKLADSAIRKEVVDAVQTFNYQVNSMTNTNGQAPFLSVNMYLGETTEYKEELAMLIEEFLKQRIQGFKNEQGVYVTPAFPKLLYVLEEDNIHENSKYWYLTELAAKCTAKRMVPDYISEKVMKENKINKNGVGDCYPCMGCRSFLTPDRLMENISGDLSYKASQGKYYGRFNQGVVTISLPDVALSAAGDKNKFWDILDERLELCHRALQARHERLSHGVSDMAPILWQYGALARLSKGESIHKLLHSGYSTISLGYAGLYECVKVMTGKSHTDPEAKDFAISVMQKLNDACNKWKAEEDIDYSVYGSPIESTTYKFAKALKKRFGQDVFIKMDGQDRNYITNSYHVPVFEEIDPFEKLALESQFQKLSPGGAISYIECANLTGNIPAVLEVIKFIYNNIMYAELNTKSDYCQVCGYDGEIKIIDENGTLDWECPNCGNRDHSKMNVARRTCGYIGSNFFNQGRTDEIRNRYVHLDDHPVESE